MIYLGIAIATVAAFLISSVFYSLAPPTPGTGGAPAAGGRRPRPWQLAVEIVRSLLVAALVAGLLTVAGWDRAVEGLLLGLSLTVLPIVLLVGSVLWEGVPARTAATHALDWIIKLGAIGAIVGAFA